RRTARVRARVPDPFEDLSELTAARAGWSRIRSTSRRPAHPARAGGLRVRCACRSGISVTTAPTGVEFAEHQWGGPARTTMFSSGRCGMAQRLVRFSDLTNKIIEDDAVV